MPLMFTYDCENASQGAPYGDAIFALPEAFFFGYSGAIFERLKVSFHCLQRRKLCAFYSENRRCAESTFLSG